MTETVAEQGEETPAPPPPDLPGVKLRRAREAAGLNVDDVARELRLTVEAIRSLEADEYHRLPGATYVTGYLRTYARTLGLDEDTILAGFQHAAAVPELVPESVHRPRRRSRVGIGVLAAVVVTILAIPGVWWWGRQGDVSGVGDGPLPSQATSPASAAAVAEQPETTGSGSSRAAVPPEPVRTATEAETPVNADEPKPATEMASESPPVTVTEAGPGPSVSAVAAVPAVADSVPPVALEMVYHNDSWTEVRDSRGEILAYRMVQAGSLLELAGIPPLTVVLGYAPGVSITYNGRPFDMSAYTRNDIARFTVGAIPRAEAQ